MKTSPGRFSKAEELLTSDIDHPSFLDEDLTTPHPNDPPDPLPPDPSSPDTEVHLKQKILNRRLIKILFQERPFLVVFGVFKLAKVCLECLENGSFIFFHFSCHCVFENPHFFCVLKINLTVEKGGESNGKRWL